MFKLLVAPLLVSTLMTRGMRLMSATRDFFDSIEVSDYESEHIKSSVLLDQQDGFYDMLMALEIETNFNLEGKGLQDEDNFDSASASTP